MVPFLNIHTHDSAVREFESNLLSLSVGHDDLTLMNNRPVALGIHPWFITEGTVNEDLSLLNELAGRSQVKMIGECGLDRLRGAPFELQLRIFEAQLRLAKRLNKPVLLHCVKAYDELIALHKKIKPQVPIVVHGFNKSEQLGKQLISQGFILSFGKVLLNENSGAALLVKKTSLFFLETDDSELPIAELYAATAKLKNVSMDELKALIFANWKSLSLCYV